MIVTAEEARVLWRQPAPDYCPDELDETLHPFCWACGASVESGPRDYCRARRNSPRPQPLVRLVLTDKRTGEIIR